MNAKTQSYGNTPTGSDWCVKALHPADPLTEVRGLPDRSSVPSLLMNYQSTFTIQPPTGSVGTWQWDMSMLPHPISFGWVAAQDISGAHTAGIDMLNPQVAGVYMGDKFNNFTNDFTRWRLAYYSFTVYQDGPDLANQGTIVVCQKPVVGKRTSFSHMVINTTDHPGTIIRTHGQSNVLYFTTHDLPNFNASQGMPSAYFGKSKEGAYVPLKLTDTCQTWQSKETATFYALSGNQIHATNGNGLAETIPVVAPGSEPRVQFPFHGTYAPSLVEDVPGGSTGLHFNGDITSAMLNEFWGDISARNLALTTSFTVFVRMGLEVQVVPSSVMAPHQKLSPPHDAAALDIYHAISRELKDAFPADYNDLGKIWDAISSGLKFASPMLKFVPGIGPLLSGGLSSIAGAGDAIRSAVAKKKATKDVNTEAVKELSTLYSKDAGFSDKKARVKIARAANRRRNRKPRQAAQGAK